MFKAKLTKMPQTYKSFNYSLFGEYACFVVEIYIFLMWCIMAACSSPYVIEGVSKKYLGQHIKLLLSNSKRNWKSFFEVTKQSSDLDYLLNT